MPWELDATVGGPAGSCSSLRLELPPDGHQAHRIMHDDGIGDIEHVSLHMDSVTRELLSETGDYPDADPETIPRRTRGRARRPPAAATARRSRPPPGRRAVADRTCAARTCSRS